MVKDQLRSQQKCMEKFDLGGDAVDKAILGTVWLFRDMAENSF